MIMEYNKKQGKWLFIMPLQYGFEWKICKRFMVKPITASDYVNFIENFQR